ncbi:hypothetical protein GCM10009837_07080 [Streptomyces durmitorensis]|uniref:Uncharacterized protein n=1 Tax=Streptomyces durmitorensis TaxID=319947 RepID=A0ABY4PLX3_9ACTN|nr:hypothetical protein [Streptomyces durmitorensis]UQT54397.1 hypothetical protein M4V62_04445 [Streptomyces durmitorensis]
MTDWTPPPPGDTREQLPDAILTLIETAPYTSTACETAGLLAEAAAVHTDQADELGAWADRMHQRCRINHKYTGRLCGCSCH